MQDDTQTDATTAASFGDVPVLVTVTVGHATPTIDELLNMSDETVISLDRGVDDPVDLYVGDKLIARGVLEEMAEDGTSRIGVRITDVVRPDSKK